MGVYATIQGHNVLIKNENFKKVEEIVEKYISENNTWYKSSEEFFDRYIFEENDDGDYILDSCYVEKDIDEDFPIFNHIAPFIENDSYINCFNEYGEYIRYYFNGKECLEQLGEIIWEDSLYVLKVLEELRENKISTNFNVRIFRNKKDALKAIKKEIENIKNTVPGVEIVEDNIENGCCILKSEDDVFTIKLEKVELE